jgi:hypothetical protein
MSLVDDTSEAGPSDLLEANDDDMSMSDPACVVAAEALSNINLNCLPTPPTSPYPTSPRYERPVSDDCSTPFSERRCRVKSTARHSPYKLHSREQRHAFIRNCRRKEMFINEPHDPLIPTAEPSTIPSMANLALPSVHVGVAAALAEARPSTTPHDAYRATQETDPTIKIPGLVDRLALRLLNSCNVSEQTVEDEDVVNCATQKSGLTIKIPGLVDRLALRLLSSCNVEGRTEEGEDVDSSSIDGYSAWDSSSNDGDIDDDTPLYCSLSSAAAGPDRLSRRKHRRRNAAPYHRARGIPKRKELWVDKDTKQGSEVPAFLLGSLPRILRSGRHCY